MFKKLILSAIVLVSGVASITATFAAGNAEAGKAKSAVCAACHGVSGISAIPINPNLAGQVPGYIAAQRVYLNKIWLIWTLTTHLWNLMSKLG